jgi:hypothetical protein
MPDAAAEMPVKPNTPAINEITKKIRAHFSMELPLSLNFHEFAA